MSNMVVRTNIFALNAHRNMKNVGLEQGRATNRLSSGFRINSAADDAAGLAISENMRAQIRGLDQASRNAQDGQAMLLTTEGGLEEIGNMLQRTRELLVQASNDTNTQDQRVMIEQEIRQLAQEISSMQQRVEFNTNRVLAMGPAMDSGIANEMALINEDMNALSDAFAIVNENLANIAVAREILSAMPPLAAISTLNQGQTRALETALDGISFATVAAFQSTGMVGEDLLSAAALESVKSSAVPGDDTVNMTIAIAALDQRRNDLDAIARELNDHIGDIHNNSQAVFSNINDFAAFREIDGVDVAAVTAKVGEWVFGALDGADTYVFTPGAKVDLSGTAAFTSVKSNFTAALLNNNIPFDLSAAVWIESADWDPGTAGYKTTVVEFYAWDVTLKFDGATELFLAVPVGDVDLRTATVGESFVVQRDIGGITAGTILKEGAGGHAQSRGWVTGTMVDAGAGASGVIPEAPSDIFTKQTVNAYDVEGEIVGTWTWDPAIRAADEFTLGGLDAGSTGNNVAFFQVGANANQGITFDFETVSRAVTAAASNVTMIATLLSNPDAGSGIGRGISVTPLIAQIQGSLDDVSRIRANLGAVQNRMDYTMRSLDISSENLQDSESRVRNADIAREMMRFTMANVLQQASVSMLAQANQLPQNLLQLLR